MKKVLILSLFFLQILGCSNSNPQEPLSSLPDSAQLYSLLGREHQVRFIADFHSRYQSLSEIRTSRLVSEIQSLHPFLFGPLTNRNLGGVQKGEKTEPILEQARIVNGRVVIPYRYSATWMIEASASQAGSLTLPVPNSMEALRTADWKSCTDTSDPEHATWSFFWYFWDPARPGCEHQEGQHYQNVKIEILQETEQTKKTFPEYARMVHEENGQRSRAMTFAFGYVQDQANPNPFQDADAGARQFQSFYNTTKLQLMARGFQERSIRASEYTSGNRMIGSEFHRTVNGEQWSISVVAAAGVDQMDLFAQSFAVKHEGFFGWFGHSRVGSGFDANILKMKLATEPEKFSISPEYQLVYWAGCNSYSYYTMPFFEMKAKLSPEQDPDGIHNLDLISNVLPSLFAFNAANANVILQALLQPEKPTTYQKLINQIENLARNWGYRVIVNVLGDEDNATPE